MGKSSSRKRARKAFSPPEQVECRECGAMCAVTYVPKNDLVPGITAVGSSKCTSCGASATHAAGDPEVVALFMESLRDEFGDGKASLTDMAGRRVRD